MKQGKFILPLIGLTLLSCQPNLDFDKFNSVQYNGEWEMPLVNANLSIEDILVEDTLFTVDPDGGLRIIYENDSLFGFSIEDFTKVPNQDPLSTLVPLDLPTITAATSMNTLGGAKFKTFTVKNGDLRFTTSSSLVDTVKLSLTINNATLNGSVFQTNINAPTGNHTSTVDISGLMLDLTNGGTTQNYLSFTIAVVDKGSAPLGSTIDLELQYENLTCENAVGYFGSRRVNIPSGDISLGIGAFEKFLNGLYLENPLIDLIITSNVGLPFGLNLDLDGVNGSGNVTSLGLDTINMAGPSFVGDYDTTHVIINKNTSNIVDFISNVPNTILFSGNGTMNPNGETTTDNFITADGEMYLGLKMDLPLELRTQNLVFHQTIDSVDFGGLADQDNPVEKLTMFFKVENEFPLDASLKLIFKDLQGVSTDTVILNLFSAAPVDANGRSTGYAFSSEAVELTSAKIDHLIHAKSLLIEAVMNTSNNGNTVVKIYEDYDVKVHVGMKVKLKYDVQ